MLKINLAALIKNTRIVGPGLRDALYVQGCSIGCPGCYNQNYLPHSPGKLLSVNRLIMHARVRRDIIDGISLLGGEPSEQAPAVAALLAAVRKLGLSTVVFSGQTLEELNQDLRYAKLLQNTDLLIDGPFQAAQYDPSLLWRGSSNQRLLLLSSRWTWRDMKFTGPDAEIILSDDAITMHGTGIRRIGLT